jgi:translation initiation factor 6
LILLEIDLLSVKGSPHIGIYIFVNDEIAIVPQGLTKSEEEKIQEILDVDVIRARIASTDLIGVMIAGNNNGIVFPRNILDVELESLKPHLAGYDLNIYVSRSKHTALGNLVSANSKRGIVGAILEEQEVKRMAETLGVELKQQNIMHLDIPGSLLVVTDNGGVIHPDVDDNELSMLEDYFKVGIERATVNAGIPFIKSGLIANNHGALVGGKTTGPEILRIKRGLGGG